MDEFRLIPDDQPGALLALIFTGAQGRVISLPGPRLDWMRMDDPGAIIGKPLYTVLGIALKMVGNL